MCIEYFCLSSLIPDSVAIEGLFDCIGYSLLIRNFVFLLINEGLIGNGHVSLYLYFNVLLLYFTNNHITFLPSELNNLSLSYCSAQVQCSTACSMQSLYPHPAYMLSISALLEVY